MTEVSALPVLPTGQGASAWAPVEVSDVAYRVSFGTGLTVTSGVLSVSYSYSLPTASTTVLGGVKVDGSTVTINGSGVISASTSYTLPTATTSVLGGVKVDGTTITIAGGVISAATGGSGTITGVTAGTGLTGGGTTGTVTLAVAYGTTSTTAAAGNDSRITGALPTSGGTMTGALTLSGAPSVPLHAATKAYVDSSVGAGGGGTITGVTAGTGLTGGGTTGTVTLSVAYGTSGTTAAAGNDSRITGAEQTTNKAAANGYASLDGSTKVPIAQIPTGTTGTTVALGNDSRLGLAATALQSTAIPSATTSQLYGGTGGAGLAGVVTLGTNLSITAGVLNAAGGSGSGTVNTGTTNTLAFYAANGTSVSPLTLGTNLSISGTTLNAAGGSSSAFPVTTVAASSTAQTLTFPASGLSTFDVTLTGNCAFSFNIASITAGQRSAVEVWVRAGTGGFTPSYPAGVKWSGPNGSVAPNGPLASGALFLVTFKTPDAGTTIVGEY